MECVDSLDRLRSYCESQHFKGWDPYDGLNSKVFQAIPFLKKSALCRLVVIQGFKRCPVNLRPIAFVPQKYKRNRIVLACLLQSHYKECESVVVGDERIVEKGMFVSS